MYTASRNGRPKFIRHAPVLGSKIKKGRKKKMLNVRGNFFNLQMRSRVPIFLPRKLDSQRGTRGKIVSYFRFGRPACIHLEVINVSSSDQASLSASWSRRWIRDLECITRRISAGFLGGYFRTVLSFVMTSLYPEQLEDKIPAICNSYNLYSSLMFFLPHEC